MRLAFTKMHGLGNDFIVFDSPAEGTLPSTAALRRLADRHTGIGFDQALVLAPPRVSGTDVFYRVFNSDGSEVEQCANGARCIASLVARRLGRSTVRLDSPGGRIAGELHADGSVSLDMGEPNFDPAALPFEASREADIYPLRVGEQELQIGAVSMGNPHAVIQVPAVRSAPVDTLGPAVENHSRFPRRTNVGFMEVVGARAHPVARPRTRRRRDASVRYRRLRRGGGRAQARTAAGDGSGRRAGRRHDGALGRSGRALVAHRSGGQRVRGDDRDGVRLKPDPHEEVSQRFNEGEMTKQPVGRLDEETREETAIADYLQSNPDFFERHATLLTKLKLPHNRGSSAISLVERQVAALRDNNEKLETRLRELIEVARGNDVLAAKIHRLACRLVRGDGCGRRDGRAGSLAPRRFRRIRVAAAGARGRRVAAVEGEQPPPAPDTGGRDRVEDVRDAVRVRPAALRPDPRQPARLPVRRRHGGDRLRGARPARRQNGGKQSGMALLAIGSPDAERFHPTMSTEFLARIGDLVSEAVGTA